MHHGIICDGCEKTPIVGIRYKCSVNADMDFCEDCEAKKTHQYPFLKIRKPGTAPSTFRCGFQMEHLRNSNNKKRFKEEKKTEEKKKIYYQARFVKESFGDRHKVSPGCVFQKTWTFKNSGETAWPLDTHFMMTNGDSMNAMPSPLALPVNPGEQIDVTCDFISPMEPGKYCSFFRFFTGDN